jgi:hypothetical protein
MALQVNPRELTMTVRELADSYQNWQAGRSPGERRPLADVLAERIPGELIPALRQLYLDMIAMSAEWQEKKFQAALAEAAANNQLLAGYAPSTWLAWGSLLLALLDFLDTPQAGLGGLTARDALLDRYIPTTPEQWAVLNPPTPPVVVPPEPEPEPEPGAAP